MYITRSVFDRFTAWFNQNLKGETVYTADDATLRRRIAQWGHLDGLTPDELVELATDVWFAKQTIA